MPFSGCTTLWTASNRSTAISTLRKPKSVAAPERIFLLCGTLEPGKDGVGDYSRQLAAALVARGLAVRLVASHDKFAGHVVEEQLMLEEATIAITRIPYAEPAAERLRLLRLIIETFRPDWLSLQYVPYSFNSRGYRSPSAACYASCAITVSGTSCSTSCGSISVAWPHPKPPPFPSYNDLQRCGSYGHCARRQAHPPTRLPAKT